jgi:predicted nuclease of predicted toxin-antitoxin system
LRFLLDEDLPPLAAEVARGLGLDVTSVHEVGRLGLGDRDQLRFAAAEGCIFLTRNHRDFIELTVEFYRAGEAHPGVLLVRRHLPNDRPERIVHALKRWAEERKYMPPTMFDGVDFL